MLDKKDEKTIKKIVKEIVDGSIEAFTVKILKPSFDSMAAKGDLKKYATMEQIDNRFDKMEQKIEQMAVETSIKRDLKLNKKTNRLAEKLEKKKIFNSQGLSEIKKISPLVTPA